ncbi:MAG: CTP synthase [Planctomycetes bacterium]|nr:CTP synthase [Planctomycetota bacterium]MCW8136154.1 CTP synthase [Planctomycetota bacterium]
MTKHAIITGGVVSSLGKGLTTACIGALLEARGLRVRIQKFDPYINVDAGTMNPFQHGEVYVTQDGGETDLDLGHYERYTSAPLSRSSNITSGRIYQTVINKERQGAYLGGCVQVVPHITNEIKRNIRQWDGPECDIVLSELGGTAGDIEGAAFLEAFRQFAYEHGRDHTVFIHLTLVPYLRASGELKTKPTQQSVGVLRQIGIQPDMLVCRTEKPITQEMRDKIAMFCNVEKKHVFEERDVENTIYELPLVLHQEGVDEALIRRLGLPEGNTNLEAWQNVVHTVTHPTATVDIAVVGKYVELKDAYKSVYESIDHAGIANKVQVKVHRINAEELNDENVGARLRGMAGILVPGGFGERGIEGKISAVRFARENKVPYYGLCLGMQIAVIEFARHVAGMRDANSTEFSKETQHPVITLLKDQVSVKNLGGTMRLGAQPCKLIEGTVARAAYGVELVSERHRHRYEFNNEFRGRLTEKGLVISGVNPELDLVEIVELKDHPFFVGVQFHPEFQSKPLKPHALFTAFVKAASERHKAL